MNNGANGGVGGSGNSSTTEGAQNFLKQLLAGEKNGVIKKESLKKIYGVSLMMMVSTSTNRDDVIGSWKYEEEWIQCWK